MNSIVYYKDWRFWLLLLVISISGNLVFNMMPYKAILECVFIIISLTCFKMSIINLFCIINILLWGISLLLSGMYQSDAFSFSSTIHVFMKIYIGLALVLIIKKCFVSYFCKIMFFFAIVSLLCFMFNCFNIVLPYIPVDGTNIDGGHVYRVSSIVYTQLCNLDDGNSLSLRNCGPFWEPGAFQGFINMALIFDCFYNPHNRGWIIRTIVFILTIITTFSTGGYIVLFIMLFFFICQSCSIQNQYKFFLKIILVSIGIYCFISFDFLGNKISNDSGRMNLTISDFCSASFFFGYGYSEKGFSKSSIESVSSIFNLIQYSGLLGICLYFMPFLFCRQNVRSIVFFIILVLVLMDEPFLTSGPFWWSIPFLFYELESECGEIDEYGRMFLRYI